MENKKYNEKTYKLLNTLPDIFSKIYHEESLRKKVIEWIDNYYNLCDECDNLKDEKDKIIDALTIDLSMTF